MSRFTELGLLVRAGALTDLYLGGLLIDAGGRAATVTPVPAHAPAPVTDPALVDLLSRIASSRPRRWKHWVGKSTRSTSDAVRDQLEADGWIKVERRRILGVVPSARVTVRDRAAVKELGRQTGRALRGSVPVDRVDPGDAAVVALAAACELRTMAGRRERREHSKRIDALALATGPVAPALKAALREAAAS
jgi:hypothetical protein